MRTTPFLSRRARWAVPGGVVAVVAGAVAASAITVAQAAPGLPSRTPAELLAAVGDQTGPPPPLTGTVVETASLGIPQLPGGNSPNNITSLLAGSHTVKVWYADPRHIRLAVPVQLGETDFIRNGNTGWMWQSSQNSVTKYVLPAGDHARAKANGEWHGKPLTPQEAAQRVLAAVGPSTRVTTQSNVMVAGQAAYQLVISPKDTRSLVGKITIAVDGAHPSVPLRVQVFARGAKSPAFQVGYTSISFVRPAAANFAFTPPRGAHVHTVTPPAKKVRYKVGQASALQIIGKDWLSVAVLPASDLSGLAGGNAAGLAGQAARSAAGQGGGSGSGKDAAIMAALLKSAAPVHGAWGSGRLLKTSLVSVLITSDGHVLAGAVTPQVLYSAAAQAK
jgi:outer membrane lipoprotein-sorting protein